MKLIVLSCLLFIHGCMTIYECEGDHKEQYNNVSPTTQQSDTTNSGDDKSPATQTTTNPEAKLIKNQPTSNSIK